MLSRIGRTCRRTASAGGCGQCHARLALASGLLCSRGSGRSRACRAALIRRAGGRGAMALTALVAYLHLGAVILLIACVSVAAPVVRLVYRVFPFPAVLDRLYLHSSWLRKVCVRVCRTVSAERRVRASLHPLSVGGVRVSVPLSSGRHVYRECIVVSVCLCTCVCRHVFCARASANARSRYDCCTHAGLQPSPCRWGQRR